MAHNKRAQNTLARPCCAALRRTASDGFHAPGPREVWPGGVQNGRCRSSNRRRL